MNAPLTPADCDLTDFQRMMIDIPRLRGSDFDATLDDGAWRAGINLWLTAWHQVPAASLTDDEVALTKAAGLGRDVRTWRKVRDEALRGWVKCNDGLLYHPVVAEFALEAWLEKLTQALSSGAGNAKRWKIDFDPAPIEADMDRTAEMLRALNPKSKALSKLERRRARPSSGSDNNGTPTGNEKPSHLDAKTFPSGSQGTGTGNIDSPQPPGGQVGLELAGKEPDPPDEARVAFDLWNETAAACGLPKAKTLDENRRKAIRKRLETGGLEHWREAMRGVTVSAFLRGLRPGSDGRAFKADLTFVCQAKSYQKLVDGAYGEDVEPPPQPGEALVEDDPWPRRVGEYMRNAYWNRLDWGPPPGKPGCTVSDLALKAAGFEANNLLSFPGRPAA